MDNKEKALNNFLNKNNEVKNNALNNVKVIKAKGLVEVAQVEKIIITEDGRQLLK